MSANAVTALLRIPYCASRVVSVAPIIANGKPDEMPESAAERRGLEVGAQPSGKRARQWTGAAATGEVIVSYCIPASVRSGPPSLEARDEGILSIHDRVPRPPARGRRH